MASKTREAGAYIGDHLAEIAQIFRPGMKLTFIARDPDHDDGSRNMITTNDDLDAIARAVDIAKTQRTELNV